MRRLFLCLVLALLWMAAPAGAQERVICVEGCGSGDDDPAIRAAVESSAESLNNIETALNEDAIHDNTAAASGPQMQGEAKDFDGSALPNAVSAEGDAVRMGCSLYGVCYVMLTNEDGSKSPLVVEDVAQTADNVLMGVGTVRRDAAASSAGSDGDNATVNTDALGLAWTRFLDPCSGVAKSYIPIDITTATTTELTSALAGASNHYYVCALNIVTTAANNVALVDDDTDNCASVTSGIIGGLTAGEGWNFAANGGLTIGNGVGSVMRTNGTNRVLCLVTSAATELHGHIVVAAAP